ncbi:hypothetical protein [Streptomyces sp. NPDC005407]
MGATAWVDGGWGVDAEIDVVRALLEQAGFTVVLRDHRACRG